MMATEVELKLEYVGEDWERVRADLLCRPLMAGLVAGAPRRRLVIDRYWDTADKRLGANRIALRVRLEGGHSSLELKHGDRQTAGVFSRFELTAELGAPGWEQVSGELERLGVFVPTPPDFRALAADEPAGGLVLALFATSQRQERVLFRDGTAHLALTVDEVTYRGIPDLYRDVEVEALQQGANPQSVGRELFGRYPGQWRTATMSKLARGLLAQERNSSTSPSSRR